MSSGWWLSVSDAEVDHGGTAPLDLWATLAAPLVVGIALWLIAELVRYLASRRRLNRQRRRRIVANLARAGVLLSNAMEEGIFDEAWVQRSMAPLARLRERYDDLTMETLDLFVPGEERVAFWTAVEFYAAFRDPFARLEEAKVPRAMPPDGIRLVSPWSGYYLPPRHAMLYDWSIWRAVGPRYAEMFTYGDVARHNVVIPNSDSNADMLRPPIWLDSTKVWEPVQDPPKLRPWYRKQDYTYQEGDIIGL